MAANVHCIGFYAAAASATERMDRALAGAGRAMDDNGDRPVDGPAPDNAGKPRAVPSRAWNRAIAGSVLKIHRVAVRRDRLQLGRPMERPCDQARQQQ